MARSSDVDVTGDDEGDGGHHRRPVRPALVPQLAAFVRRHRYGLEVGLAVVVVTAGIALRFLTTSDLWLDEALTVNISRLPPDQILDALRQEVHPPLYYLLLHAWMGLVGEGDVAARSLSSVVSVLALPLAWSAGARLAGRAGGLAALLLLASSPFLIRYASEARMYAFLVLLVLAAWLALQRALDRPSPVRLLVLAALTATLLLTHYWVLYLLFSTVVLLAWRCWRGGPATRTACTRVLVGLGVGGLALVPWLVYVFADQSMVETTFRPSRPGPLLAGLVVGVTSGEAVLFGMALFVLIGLALFARPSGPARMEIDLTRRSLVVGEVLVAVMTVLVAALAGFILDVGAEARHATVAVPPVLLAAAYGVTRLPSWSLRTGVTGAVAACGLLAGLANAWDARTQAGDVAAVIRPVALPGDMVVYCPDQLGPAVSRLLPPGLRSRTFPESTLGPERVEWAGYADRVDGADPVTFARSVSADAGSATIWLAWYGGAAMVGGRCQDVARELERLRPTNENLLTTPSESQDAWFEKAWLARYPAG